MSTAQQAIVDSLPVHLRPFVAYQDYSRYTPRDQAVWRFLLHQLHTHLSHTAHEVYLRGLEGAGINLEYIPRIEDMNQALGKIGWRAIVVDGYIPGSIFMEFQAHRVLVIAVDMRSFEHMLYTPAPDIVHESAGHAPFLVDVDYAEFLQRFGELGMRAIARKEDVAVYEAIRHLSIVKESPTASAADIADAERELRQALADNKQPSEAALLARLYWWTVEYGLVGDVNDYRIFGAGLLSSLGESVHCLDDERVEKKLLTVDAINIDFDITEEQSQLFVTRNCRHLTQVLEQFGRQMCVSQGGAPSLRQAIEARTANTAVTNSGISVSSVFTEVRTDAVDNVTFIRTSGPTQLAYRGKQLPGQGIDRHPHGFSSPIGRLVDMERCLSCYTMGELEQHEIRVGNRVTLNFLSGTRVSGLLENIVRRDQKNLIFTFRDCMATDPDGARLYEPDWGPFDMLVGDSITSVYGSVADQEAFPQYKQPSAQATRDPAYDRETGELFRSYHRVRVLRETDDTTSEQVMALLEEIDSRARREWLLCFEAIELAHLFGLPEKASSCLVGYLEEMAAAGSADQRQLIAYGMERLRTCRRKIPRPRNSSQPGLAPRP